MPESSAQMIKMSFSGSDADVYAYVPSSDADNQTKLVYLDSIQTLSVSTFREKSPVRALGYTNVKGHTRGVRTIAGSMIFAVMNDHPLWELSRRYDYEWSFDRYIGTASSGSSNIFPDVIPPFNVMIMYQNELGSAALVQLMGVDITNDGLVTSVEDLLTEKTIQYRARDLRVFEGVTGANQLNPRGPQPVDPISRMLLDGEVSDLFGIDPKLLYDTTGLPVPQSDSRTLFGKLRSLMSG